MDHRHPTLWQTFFCSTLREPVPALLSRGPSTHPQHQSTCGRTRFTLDPHGDHVSTCKSHSRATKAPDWMVTELGPLFRTTGHQVKTQGITPKSGLKRGDLEIVSYLADAAGSRNLVIDVSITYDRIGSSTAHPHLNAALS